MIDTRRWPLLLLVLAIPSATSAADKNVTPRPNVLFLAVDDMNDWVNCLGGYKGTVHTPHIDRLANQGMLFTNAHCASPKCAPSRAAIIRWQEWQSHNKRATNSCRHWT